MGEHNVRTACCEQQYNVCPTFDAEHMLSNTKAKADGLVAAQAT